MRRYPFPGGPIVDQVGTLTMPARDYLSEIQRRTEAVNDVAALDPMTTYTADQLRDKIIALMTALKG